ncbi:hypothetical protein MMC11_002775 [Xylographa trunciseda]|nr:hypothetical protein [Xylographa trunciseda]
MHLLHRRASSSSTSSPPGPFPGEYNSFTTITTPPNAATASPTTILMTKDIIYSITTNVVTVAELTQTRKLKRHSVIDIDVLPPASIGRHDPLPAKHDILVEERGTDNPPPDSDAMDTSTTTPTSTPSSSSSSTSTPASTTSLPAPAAVTTISTSAATTTAPGATSTATSTPAWTISSLSSQQPSRAHAPGVTASGAALPKGAGGVPAVGDTPGGVAVVVVAVVVVFGVLAGVVVCICECGGRRAEALVASEAVWLLTVWGVGRQEVQEGTGSRSKAMGDGEARPWWVGAFAGDDGGLKRMQNEADGKGE